MGRRESLKQVKNQTTVVARPAGVQAMGMELYQQIRQAMAELKPA